MADEMKDKDVEIEPLSDAELEGVAGGAADISTRLDEGSSNGCCTCSGDNCSLTEGDEPPTVG